MVVEVASMALDVAGVMKMVMFIKIKTVHQAIIVDEVTTNMIHVILQVIFGFEMNPIIRIKK